MEKSIRYQNGIGMITLNGRFDSPAVPLSPLLREYVAQGRLGFVPT